MARFIRATELWRCTVCQAERSVFLKGAPDPSIPKRTEMLAKGWRILGAGLVLCPNCGADEVKREKAERKARGLLV